MRRRIGTQYPLLLIHPCSVHCLGINNQHSFPFVSSGLILIAQREASGTAVIFQKHNEGKSE